MRPCALECRELSAGPDTATPAAIQGVSFRLLTGQGGMILADYQDMVTTLFRVCSTLEIPRRGQVVWFDTLEAPLDRRRQLEARRRIGYVHQGSRLVSNMSLGENVALGLIYHRGLNPRAAEGEVMGLMERFGLQDIRHLRPDEAPHPKRRLALYVRELAKQPSLFLLENPNVDLEEDFDIFMADIRARADRGEAAFLFTDIMASMRQEWADWVMHLSPEGCRMAAHAWGADGEPDAGARPREVLA